MRHFVISLRIQWPARWRGTVAGQWCVTKRVTSVSKMALVVDLKFAHRSSGTMIKTLRHVGQRQRFKYKRWAKPSIDRETKP